MNESLAHTMTLIHAEYLRKFRDEMALAWLANEIRTIGDVERMLNEKIRSMGVETITGDTTL